MFHGESAPASGWFARGQRLLDADGGLDCVERFGDDDLIAIARMEQGHALVRLGRPAEGLRLCGRDDGGRHHR
jgi:hypothetical protein